MDFLNEFEAATVERRLAVSTRFAKIEALLSVVRMVPDLTDEQLAAIGRLYEIQFDLKAKDQGPLDWDRAVGYRKHMLGVLGADFDATVGYHEAMYDEVINKRRDL